MLVTLTGAAARRPRPPRCASTRAAHGKTLLAGVLLVPGFPAAWLVAGKKRGLDAAVRHVVKTYKAGIVELLVVKIAERLRRAEWTWAVSC